MKWLVTIPILLIFFGYIANALVGAFTGHRISHCQSERNGGKTAKSGTFHVLHEKIDSL